MPTRIRRPGPTRSCRRTGPARIVDCMSQAFDVAVIGTGLFGSAAAKYLSFMGAEVVLIGPQEPQTQSLATPAEFSAHYDEARITRRLGWDAAWGEFDSRSLDRFRSIEHVSGVEFFHECGSLVLMAGSIRTRTDSIMRDCAERSIHVDRLDESRLKATFPMLHTPQLAGGVEALWEPADAGYLDPRSLVRAQLALTRQAGGTVVRGVASDITRDTLAGSWRIKVNKGDRAEVNAQQVLLATGALTNHLNLLPPSAAPLALHVFEEPNLLLEVSSAQLPELRQLAPVVTVDPADNGNDNMSVYLIPPVLYPDGRWYVRIGPGMQPIVQELSCADDMIDWYRRQRINTQQKSFLAREAHRLLPQLSEAPSRGATCLIEKTPTRLPFLGPTGDDPSMSVMVGGNGHGARGSDEIGRLAARQALGMSWDSSIAEARFVPTTMDNESRPRPGFLKPPFGLC